MNEENILRLGVFLSILGALIILERIIPRRKTRAKKVRLVGNLGVGALNVLLLSLLPISAVGASLFAVFNKFGLLFWLQWSLWTNIIVSLLILDLAIYWQHRIFHIISQAWPVHRMHHTDTAIDVTTALRFHPIEIAISILIKAIVIILIGAPLLAVIAFEILLNGAAMFNHSNIHLPKNLDRALRWVVVTPDMHRVHHSVHQNEHNANYGFCLSWWDMIFKSYIPAPRDGHLNMKLGQNKYRATGEARLDRLITQPFR